MSIGDDAKPPLLLLSCLGTRLEKLEYRLADEAEGPVAFGRSAAVAIASLLHAHGLEKGPWKRLLVLSTPTAFGTEDAPSPVWRATVDDAARAGLPAPERLSLPESARSESLNELVTTIAAEVPTGARLVLDVSNGIRHLPLFMTLAALVLSEARGVSIGGPWSAAPALGGHGQAPVVDCSWLPRASEMIAGLAALRAGSVAPLATVLGSFGEERGRLIEVAKAGGGEMPPPLDERGEKLQAAFETALAPFPIEAGLGPPSWAEKETGVLRSFFPLLAAPVEEAMRLAEDLRLPVRSKITKDTLVLDGAVLDQQRMLVEFALNHGRLGTAAVLSREWATNRRLLALGVTSSVKGAPKNRSWLHAEMRAMIADRPLGALTRLVREPELREALALGAETLALGEALDRLQALRNPLAHAGHDTNTHDVGKTAVELREVAEALWNTSHAAWEFELAAGPPLVLTPFGNSPGILVTLLHQLRDFLSEHGKLVVLTSEESATVLPEALRRADWPEDRVAAEIRVVDAFRCHEEAQRHWREHLSVLVGAGRLCVNVTGGTTAMQLLAQRLAGQVRSLEIPVRTVGVVDERSPEEQLTNPWVVGTLLDCDNPAADVKEDER